MRAFLFAMIFAVVLAYGTAGAAPVDFRFLPAKIGDTVTLTYEVQSPGLSTHEIITLTRTAPNRLTVTITPEGGAPVAFFQPIGDDGALEPVEDTGVGSGALTTPAQGTVTTSTPLPRYPRDPYAQRRRENAPRSSPEPSAAPRANAFTPQLPPQVAEIASMAVVASGPGSNQRTWTYASTPGTPPVKSTLTRTQAGTSTILVADGTGYGTTLHLECVFRDGTFVGARGTERVVLYGADPNQAPATTFTLAAFAAPSLPKTH